MEKVFEVKEQFSMQHKQTGETQSVFNGSWKSDKENWQRVGGWFYVVHAQTGIRASGVMSQDFADKCAAAFNQDKLFCPITGAIKDQ